MPTLSVRHSKAFSSYYDIAENDHHLTRLYAGSESKSEFAYAGAQYQMVRESCAGDFVLSGPEGEICRATKPSALFRSFDIGVVAGNEAYQLEASSALGESFDLKQLEELVGRVDAKGFFRKWADVDFPDSLSLPVQFFIIWLALLMWVRAKDAATTPTYSMG